MLPRRNVRAPGRGLVPYLVIAPPPHVCEELDNEAPWPRLCTNTSLADANDESGQHPSLEDELSNAEKEQVDYLATLP